MKRLVGKVAIITGGARGIGLEVASTFHQEGAKIALWDVRADEGERAAHTIDHLGGSVIFQKVDVTDKEQIEKAAEVVFTKYGQIDILINNAGIIRDRSFLKMTDEEWHSVIEVNLNSIFYVTKSILPYMKAAGYGRVVSASSINGQIGAFGQTNYAATKAAIMGFTKSLAKEVGKYGITVNAVAPGFIETEMTQQMPTAIIEASIAQIPVGRPGTPKDIAYAYLYLASEEAGFVNGTTLSVNGGLAP